MSQIGHGTQLHMGGSVASGGLTSGLPTPLRIEWLTLTSGDIAGPGVSYQFPQCVRCKLIWAAANCVAVHGISGLQEWWCWRCAGYKYEQGGAVRGFETREDWIRESAPFVSGANPFMVADWCEEQGRQKDAEYLRHRYMSGG